MAILLGHGSRHEGAISPTLSMGYDTVPKDSGSSVFNNSESIMQQHEQDYTCVEPSGYISEAHKRPCNALQELSITYFGLPEEELVICWLTKTERTKNKCLFNC